MTCRPGHPARHPDFEPGNELTLRHGGYSAKRIGERAQLVAQEVLELAPHLSAPEFALAVSSYAMARARTELLSAAIEEAVAAAGAVRLGARIIEAATGASREEATQRASLGLDPKSLAELRKTQAETALTMSVLVREAPAVLEAMRQTLSALGLAERCEEFDQVFAKKLALVAGDDDDDE